MTEKITTVIAQIEAYIQTAEEADDESDYLEPISEIIEKLIKLENNSEAIQPILELIERNSDIDYGGPGPLGHFLEKHSKKGYEELLLKSIARKPTVYTLDLLHRLVTDKENPNHKIYLDLMIKISLSTNYPEDIIESAKENLSYLE